MRSTLTDPPPTSVLTLLLRSLADDLKMCKNKIFPCLYMLFFFAPLISIKIMHDSVPRSKRDASKAWSWAKVTCCARARKRARAAQRRRQHRWEERAGAPATTFSCARAAMVSFFCALPPPRPPLPLTPSLAPFQICMFQLSAVDRMVLTVLCFSSLVLCFLFSLLLSDTDNEEEGRLIDVAGMLGAVPLAIVGFVEFHRAKSQSTSSLTGIQTMEGRIVVCCPKVRPARAKRAQERPRAAQRPTPTNARAKRAG